MSAPPLPARKTKKRVVWRWIRRFVIATLIFTAFYFVAAQLLCRIPVNRDFQHAENGVEIAILSNGVHIDIAVPLRHSEFDWTEHLREEDFKVFHPSYHTAIFGWGERTFYLQTPTWADVNPLLIARAMTGMGSSVMHVELANWTPLPSPTCRKLRLSRDQYKILCYEIRAAMQTNEKGELRPIANAHYHQSDAFYEGNGHYHLFHTCNAWSGGVLRKSGVRMGLWTPTTGGVFACLPADCP
jgi:uncharacterized protein (TIGR02117 family)